MAGRNALRGSRIGAGPMGDSERGEAAPRQRISFWCASSHHTYRSFADDADVPETWDCPRCGCPAGRDQANPPPANHFVPTKSHLAYVRERRNEADGEVILEEALAKLRQLRG